jgi:hypothetical protein
MGFKKDLTGVKKHKLIIISFSYAKDRKNNKKNYYWKAQCECGNYKIVDGNSFNAGRIKTCGCSHIKHGVNSPYIGNIYNNIKITKYLERCKTVGKSYKRTGHFYEYQCLICNYIGRKQDNFLTNTGCLNCRDKGLSLNGFPLWFINRLKLNAKQRNIEYNLSAEYLFDLYKKQKGICSLSGQKLTLSKRWKDYKNNTASLDRIDSNKGYIINNVQFVHKNINFMKYNFSQKEFIDLCIKIVNNIKGK